MGEQLRVHRYVQGHYEKSPLKDLSGVWRKDLGSMEEGLRVDRYVRGDYEKSPLKKLRGVRRKDLGENRGRTYGASLCSGGL